MGKGKDIRPYKIRAPKDLKDYILRHCAETHYIIFDRKQDIALCTCCRKHFHLHEMPWLIHEPDNRVRTHCPECGIEATPKDMRYGRKKLLDVGRITWTAGYKGVTFIETDRFSIDYDKGIMPVVQLVPDQQIRLSKKSQERWDFYDGWWSAGEWRKIKRIKYKAKPSTWLVPTYWQNRSRYHDHLYYASNGGVSVGTDLKYVNDDIDRFDDGYSDEFKMIRRIIQYLSDFLKYPAIEILDKSGFGTLVCNRASAGASACLNLRAKDLRKILKVGGADVKDLRKMEYEGPTLGFMEDLHRIRKLAPWAKVEDIKELTAIGGSAIQDRMDFIRANADISKVLRRLLEERRATGDHIQLRDYADYLEAVIALGMRMDKRTLYPTNFMDAHNRALAQLNDSGIQIEDEKFKMIQISITKMAEPFIDDRLGLMIRPAVSPQELCKESLVLNHCVRTYADRVAKGTTSILFIRKTDAPETPYFTLEMSPAGKVVQCRGLRNCSYPEEVGQFIAEWEAWRKGLLKEQMKEAAKQAGAPAA